MKHTLPFALVVLLFGAIFPAKAKNEKWVEARTANFIVVSNASPQQARNTAIQFEQIRELFQQSLAVTKGRSTPVIIILAAKDENTMKELLPEFWAEKGHAHPAGLFISFTLMPSVAVQLSGVGDNPYEAIYHEYYHSLTVPYFPAMPVWVSEGLADFYGNSQIIGKEASLGMPDAGLVELLRHSSLIPLSTLFQVDRSSPYYNEANKVSVFYAESWALTHYLMVGDKGAHRPEFTAYLNALGQGESQQDAAAKAFGDLSQLQKTLQVYAREDVFNEFRVSAPAKVEESEVQVRSLSGAEADAYQGGFLALHNQYKDADALLQEAVGLDPKLALARQNLGLSDYQQGKSAEAVTTLSAAIELDPHVALTRFLRADLVSRQSASGQSDSQVEADLRAATAANPNFAPAYELLANHLGSRGEHLQDALEFAQKGVSLQPANTFFQIVLGRVLARMQNYDQAQAIAFTARANARDAADKAAANELMDFIRRAKDAESRNNQIQNAPAATTTVDTTTNSAEPDEEAPKPNDGHLSVDGTITDIQCKVQAMQITVTAEDGPVKLHSSDYAKIDFISDVPLKSEEFWPCTSLKGKIVRVKYLPSTPGKSQPYKGEINGVEIRR